MVSALDKQPGGSHYKDQQIQPIEYTLANGLGFCEGNVIKYVTRHKEKNGKEDILKAIHYLEFILEFQYGKDLSGDKNNGKDESNGSGTTFGEHRGSNRGRD